MKNKNKPQIISVQASAGSGKTYSLAKRYLYLLMNKDNEARLNNIIAVTFTNKAAIEMKYRVIMYLKKAALSLDTQGVFDSLNLTQNNLAKKSSEVLEDILNNYDSFNISTIDSFKNHILKSCAINIDLSPNFRIEKDYSEHLMFSLDSFLESANRSEVLQNILIEYISQYIMSEKTGWFPKNDIYNEIDKVYKKAGNTGKEIAPGGDPFREGIILRSKKIFKKISSSAERFMKLNINAHNKKAIQKVLDEKEKLFYNINNIPARFAKKELQYNKNAQTDTYAQEIWKEICDDIEELCTFYSKNYYGIYSDIYSKINKEFEVHAKKDDLIFLNEINKKAISVFEDDTFIMPEVYYRLSEKYKHFLIDEFQDTSPVQWSGIKHFLEESIASGGTFFFVGDVKQAIYNFRGGNSEIFFKAEEEFSNISCEKELLKENYRSHKEIVDFNNYIFSISNISRYISEYYKEEDISKYAHILKIYDNSFQNFNPKKDKGYIEISVIPKDLEDKDEEIKNRLIKFVKSAAERFALEDIAVLCRTNDEASIAGTWLIENGFNIESVKTLNIKNNNIIKQLMSLIMFIDSPIDEIAFSSFILGEIFVESSGLSFEEIENFLFEHHTAKLESKIFYKDFQDKYQKIWDEYFEEFFVKAGFVPLYELVLSVLEKFSIVENFIENKAYIMKFLDIIKDFEQENSGLKQFIKYFNELADKDDDILYVKNSSGIGIKIMTIHKSKGLQFPVVILPFLKLSGNKNENPFFDESGEKIDLLYLSGKMASYSSFVNEIYEREKSEDLLSELNVLYVSMTRAECELYAIIPPKSGSSNNSAVFLFGDKDIIKGSKEKYIIEKDTLKHTVKDELLCGYKDTLKNLKSDVIINLDANEARKKGTMIHFALSRIISLKGKDYDCEAERAALITGRKFLYEECSWIKDELSALFQSEDILRFFNYEEYEIFNEKEIVTSQGRVLRIDKLIDSKNEVIIIDFKSSNYSSVKNKEQVLEYMKAVSEIYDNKTIKGFIIDIEKKEIVEIK